MNSPTPQLAQPQPMAGSNFPGWTITTTARTYQLWAPRPGQTIEALSGPFQVKPRPHWAAAWRCTHRSCEGHGDYARARSLEEALSLHPKSIAEAFRPAVLAWQATQ